MLKLLHHPKKHCWQKNLLSSAICSMNKINNIKILYFCLEKEESGLGKQIPVPEKS